MDFGAPEPQIRARAQSIPSLIHASLISPFGALNIHGLFRKQICINEVRLVKRAGDTSAHICMHCDKYRSECDERAIVREISLEILRAARLVKFFQILTPLPDSRVNISSPTR